MRLVSHSIPRRAVSWYFDDNPRRIVATARYYANVKQWMLRIEGHQWPITPDMGIARFQKIPGFSLTHTPVKLFPSRKACESEVKRVLDPK